jgi:SAM-dependent methyltransferase
MNLSNLPWSARDLDALLGFIRARKLSYQPFRFTDDHEVGEGMAFLSGVSAEKTKGIVHWPRPPAEIADLIVQPAQLEYFRTANDWLRDVYDHFINHIDQQIGVSGKEFAEFGCNTGYFLYRLSQRGARRSVGLDFTNNKSLFRFFNQKLGTNAEFRFSEWDSLRHRPRYADVPEVDCCMSVVVLCHLADPLHHLTYLCSKARKAVFVWTTINDSDELALTFGNPGHFPNSLSWPVSFDNRMHPSRSLVELCLRECGFEDLRPLPPVPNASPEIQAWQKKHIGVLAMRTADAKTIYTGGRVRRRRPPDTIVPESLLPLVRRVKSWFR